MNKTCLIYLTTKEESYSNYLSLKNNIGDFIDCYYLYDNKGRDIFDFSEDIFKYDTSDYIHFNGHKIWVKYNDYLIRSDSQFKARHYKGNPQFLIIELSKEDKFKDYTNFYFIEDDIVMPNGDIRIFFEKCEHIECDLLLCSDESQDNSKSWYWYGVINNKFAYKYSIHHYIQLFRLSKSGCDLIVNKFDKSHKAHSECAIPSIIYRNGLTTKFICNELPEYKFILDYVKHPEYDDVFEYKLNTWYHPVKIKSAVVGK